jgi:putative tricarboxylic transport membrane protein
LGGFWARISTVPYKYLAPLILAVCVIAAYSSRNTMFDVGIAVGAGVLGYFMKKAHWPIAPVILGFILGPMLELALGQSLNMGGPMIFLGRPISMVFLLSAIIVVLLSVRLLKRKVAKEILRDESDL